MHYMRKNQTPFNIINSSLVDLPTMSNLSNMWNFGSSLGVILTTQILTGVFLAMQYSSSANISFMTINHLNHDVTEGSFLRILHSNGASIFFVLIFIHISRGLYFNSFIMKKTWNVGIVILILSMATAFLGYVLPWGQMSFWGATVITNLLSALPLMGKNLVIWVWGGYSVSNSTLTRFFSLHYLMPFLIIFVIILHLIFLHENKSSNPLGTNKSIDKIPFKPYFQLKDFMCISLLFFFLSYINYTKPYLLMDSENFNQANFLTTPSHIQPEWYFLFAYTILRAIPNKLGGIIGLMMSIIVLFMLSMKKMSHQFKNFKLKKIIFWNFVLNFLMLTQLGMKPVEQPFIMLSQIFSLNYFLNIFFWIFFYFVYFVLKTKNKMKNLTKLKNKKLKSKLNN